MEPKQHRLLGVEYFNRTWELMETPNRTPVEDDELLGAAHASRYHWMFAEAAGPENADRGEWLLSRVYTVLGRPEPALHHADRCLALCEEHGIGDWDLAYAHEAVARAAALAGDPERAQRHVALAREAARAISEPGDRAQFDADFATLPG